MPNGQAPCKNPYTEPKIHENANASMNHRLLRSNVDIEDAKGGGRRRIHSIMVLLPVD